MPIINFVIPPALDKRVKATIKKRGFASKAEFFRMAAFNYIAKNEEGDIDDRLDYLSKAISEEVERKFKGKRLPSAREQLANL